MTSVILLHHDADVAHRLCAHIDATPSLRVTGVAKHLPALGDLLACGVPDLLILDLMMPGLQVRELLRHLRRLPEAPRPAVMVLAVSADDPRLMDALRHGADGYFTQARSSISLLAVIDRLLHGESTMSPQIARQVRAELELPGPSALDETDRRLLNWTAQGYVAYEVARGLRLSPQAVGVRMRRLYAALESKSGGARAALA